MRENVEFVIVSALVKVGKCKDEHSTMAIVFIHIHDDSSLFWELNLILQMLLNLLNLNNYDCYMRGKRNVTVFHIELSLDFLLMLYLIWTTF